LTILTFILFIIFKYRYFLFLKSEAQIQQSSNSYLKALHKDVEYLREHKLIGAVRTIELRRPDKEGLGISITGGQEHGVPILISDIHEQGPAQRSGQLFVGDAILSVNQFDLKDVLHADAVKILSNLVKKSFIFIFMK
jgi:hypothetical protein